MRQFINQLFIRTNLSFLLRLIQNIQYIVYRIFSFPWLLHS